MRARYLILLGLGILLMSSCSRKIAVQKAYQLEDRGDNRNNNPTNDVYVTSAFIGDNLDYITFQIDVDNQSDEPITIDASNTALLMDVDGVRRRLAQPLYKDDIMRFLNNEKNLLESERKTANTTTAVLGGLDVLGSVLSGAGPAETVLRGTDYAADAVTRSQQYKLAQQSVEERIAYHDTYSLERAVIEPGTKGTFDIHFQPPMVDAFSELEIRCADHVYDFPYQLQVLKERY